jgi:hypothetical protein
MRLAAALGTRRWRQAPSPPFRSGRSPRRWPRSHRVNRLLVPTNSG